MPPVQVVTWVLRALTVAEDHDGLVFVFDVNDRSVPTADQADLVWRPALKEYVVAASLRFPLPPEPNE